MLTKRPPQTLLGFGPVSVSRWQLLNIAGGAKEMTSRPCRGWERNPDRTVMTKEFLGNISAHRRHGREKKKCLEAVFSQFLQFSSLLTHQPFSDVWNSPFHMCASFSFFFFFPPLSPCPWMWGMGAEPKVLQISRYSRRTIVTARSSSAETRLYFTCRFAAYTRTCALVLSRPHLICMYALFFCPSSTVTIENKLTFLGFIFVSSKPAEETWRRTGEVSPYSQAVNPRQVTPPPPSFSPPTPFFSLSHPFSLPPGLETLQPSSSPSFLSLPFHWTPLQLERGRHELCRSRLAFTAPAVAHSPRVSCKDMRAASFYPFILITP